MEAGSRPPGSRGPKPKGQGRLGGHPPAWPAASRLGTPAAGGLAPGRARPRTRSREAARPRRWGGRPAGDLRRLASVLNWGRGHWSPHAEEARPRGKEKRRVGVAPSSRAEDTLSALALCLCLGRRTSEWAA
jgi:hypothetical protein